MRAFGKRFKDLSPAEMKSYASEFQRVAHWHRRGRVVEPWSPHFRSGRPHYGEANGKSRFTVDQVREIRRRWEEGKVTQRQLAREFDVHPSTINHVVVRRTWVDV
jgi:hypothetical protein